MGLSVALISKNEEKNLERTLQSIFNIADEIILVDSFSTDATLEIAKQYHCKIYQEEWRGYALQKNSALDKCSMEWILFLDCDEVATPNLKNSIINAIQNSTISGYLINRKSVYLGKVMKHSWQPDWNLRLVAKSANPLWQGDEVHEELVIKGEYRKIGGDLLHYSFPDLTTHLNKTINYAKLSANKYYKQARKFKISNLIFNPLFAFFKMYFLRLGFLDGIRGFLAAFSSFLGTFLKYAYLYEKSKGSEL
ncbi:MAG TPA: glycosyltransferase family 2 protein [Bacteroidetes bacterium]|nr:glycosyltransferase family 2 protein [Bacteroidota bacterium]